MAKIIGLAMRYKGRLAIAIGATVAAAVFQLMVPPLLGDAVEGAFGVVGTGEVSREEARASLIAAFIWRR